jgi:hypothetical protein
MPNFMKNLLYPFGWLINSWKVMLSSASIGNLAEKAKHVGVNLDGRGPQNRFSTAAAKTAA